MLMNHVIASISFHVRDHAHVLALIDKMSREHPNMTRSAIVRSMIQDGATARVYQSILDEHVPNWRKEYLELIRKQQGQT